MLYKNCLADTDRPIRLNLPALKYVPHADTSTNTSCAGKIPEFVTMPLLSRPITGFNP